MLSRWSDGNASGLMPSCCMHTQNIVSAQYHIFCVELTLISFPHKISRSITVGEAAGIVEIATGTAGGKGEVFQIGTCDMNIICPHSAYILYSFISPL